MAFYWAYKYPTFRNSKNIFKALKKAKNKSLKTISFLGNGGGKCKNIADVDIIIKSNSNKNKRMNRRAQVQEITEEQMDEYREAFDLFDKESSYFHCNFDR